MSLQPQVVYVVPEDTGFCCNGVGCSEAVRVLDRESRGRPVDHWLHGLDQPAPGPSKDQPLRNRLDDPIEPTTDVAHQGVTTHEDRRRRNRFEASHWPHAFLQKPVVALDSLVR